VLSGSGVQPADARSAEIAPIWQMLHPAPALNHPKASSAATIHTPLNPDARIQGPFATLYPSRTRWNFLSLSDIHAFASDQIVLIGQIIEATDPRKYSLHARFRAKLGTSGSDIDRYESAHLHRSFT